VDAAASAVDDACVFFRTMSDTTVPHSSEPAPVACFASPASWIEGKAREQLDALARLPGVLAVAGMPDLNPGKYGPVGCSVLSRIIHPELAGSDIGCGMGLFAIDLAVRKLRLDRAAERLAALEGPWDGDVGVAIAGAEFAPGPFDRSLGTVGGGNHFCELQAVADIVEPAVATAAGIDRDRLHLLVHSGSRGLGSSILEAAIKDGLSALEPGSDAGKAYLADHDQAVRWARLNRCIIATRAAEALHAEKSRLLDLPHNLIEATPAGYLHRKGTAPADRGLVPVPGSRGTLSYLVEPLEPLRPQALASLAHGAGRKHDRATMHGRIRTSKADRAALSRNPFGGHIVCTDKDLLVEEAPEAYKSIERVIQDLVDFGLARVVATFRPLVTFKTAREDLRATRAHGAHRQRR
jgi:release factor H-coupled RctB family protein